jgi:hypothetical protein
MSQGKKFHFTDEQIAWVKEHFPDTLNAEICEYLDCSETVLRLLARSLGLEKSEAHKQRRQDKALKGIRRYFLTHKPTDNSAHLRQYCFKPGNDPRTFGGFQDGLKRGHAKRNQTIREEKARIAFGLPQRTKLHLKSQPRKKIDQRHYLKGRGYIIDNENNIAYYTDQTARAVKLETGPKRYFSFAPLPENENISN